MRNIAKKTKCNRAMTKCPCGKEIEMIEVDKKLSWYCGECESMVEYDPETEKIEIKNNYYLFAALKAVTFFIISLGLIGALIVLSVAVENWIAGA